MAVVADIQMGADAESFSSSRASAKDRSDSRTPITDLDVDLGAMPMHAFVSG